MKARVALSAVVVALLVAVPQGARAEWLPADGVFVQVQWSGWHVGLDATGTLAFVGRETEATGPLKSTTVDPAEALEYLDRLVGTGIMTMDDRYRSTRGKLMRGAGGRVGWFSDLVMDGGTVKIMMVIGEDRNEVEIDYPMQKIPCGLEEWLRDFKKLVAKELFAAN